MRSGVPHKILVRSPNWIGDQVLAYPFFYYLRKVYPSSQIVSVCVPWVEPVQFRDLIDDIFVLPKAKNNGIFSKWEILEKAASELKKMGPWDLGICLPNSFSSAWLLFRAGVRRRRGYSTDGRSFLLNDRIPWNRTEIEHRTFAYCQLLPENKSPFASQEFWGVHPQNDLDPKIPGELVDFPAAKSWPVETQNFELPEEPYWILAPGSTAESRRWPVERFIALARLIADETNWTGIVLGGPGEKAIGEILCQDQSLRLLNWVDKGPVTSFWPIFRGAQFTVSNDSGLAHIASLCGSYVQVVWGAGNPKRTEPIGPGKIRIALNPVECWPCESNVCTQSPEKKVVCLRELSAEVIWKEIKTGIGIRNLS